MYADSKLARPLSKAIGETERRRSIQQKYNENNEITPQA